MSFDQIHQFPIRIANNNEGDISTKRENQPCTLAAMTTDITSSYTLFT
jgi:hypothetical protein